VTIQQKDAIQIKYKAAVDALFNTLRGSERDRSIKPIPREGLDAQIGRAATDMRTERERRIQYGAPARTGDRPAGRTTSVTSPVKERQRPIAIEGKSTGPERDGADIEKGNS